MAASLETIRKDVVALLPRLRRFALSLTANTADADDLVQDTVERAFKNLHRWEAGTRLDWWLFRMAQNLWIDQVRARKVRATEPLEGSGAENVAIDGARAIEAKLTFDAMTTAMAKLPEDQRVAVSLICVEGMSYRDAAELLGIPMGTLTSRMFRARTSLAAALGDEPAPEVAS